MIFQINHKKILAGLFLSLAVLGYLTPISIDGGVTVSTASAQTTPTIEEMVGVLQLKESKLKDIISKLETEQRDAISQDARQAIGQQLVRQKQHLSNVQLSLKAAQNGEGLETIIANDKMLNEQLIPAKDEILRILQQDEGKMRGLQECIDKNPITDPTDGDQVEARRSCISKTGVDTQGQVVGVKTFMNNVLQPRIDRERANLTLAQELIGQVINASPTYETGNAGKQAGGAVEDTKNTQAGSNDQTGLGNPSGTYCTYSYGLPDDWFVCIQSWISAILYAVMMTIAWFLAMAGLFFDTVLKFTVVNMKANALDPKGLLGSTVGQGWTAFRDLGNLVFIFVLLYAAIQTILNLNYGDTKRLIRNIIIIGLLVNFSLFFTKVLIDASNILAVAFYKVAIPGDGTNLYSFTEQFAKPLGVMNAWDPDTFYDKVRGNYSRMIIMFIGTSVFLLLTAFTFLYAAILFVIRFLALVILMIVSPLAYLAFVLPGLRKKISEPWWNTLVGQLIFAPLYLLLIYLVLILSNSVNSCTNLVESLLPTTTKTGEIGYAAATAGTCADYGAIGGILNFVIIIGFMNFATVIATQYAKQGASAMGTVVGWAHKTFNPKTATSRIVARGTAGTASAVGRQSIGRIATRMVSEDSKTGAALRRGVVSNSFIGRTLSRASLKGLEKTSEATFDVRNTQTAQSFAKSYGLDLGKAKQKGFAANEKEIAENLQKDIEKYGAPTEATRKEIAARRDELEELKEKKRKSTDAKEKLALRKQIIDKQKEVGKAEKKGAGERKAQQTARMEYLATTKNPFGANPIKKEAYRQAFSNFLNKKPEKDKEEAERIKELQSVVDDAIKAAGDGDAVSKAKTVASLLDEHEIKPGDLAKFDLDVLTKPEVIHALDKREFNAIKKRGDKGDLSKKQIENIVKTILDRKDHEARDIVENVKKDSAWYIGDSRQTGGAKKQGNKNDKGGSQQSRPANNMGPFSGGFTGGPNI